MVFYLYIHTNRNIIAIINKLFLTYHSEERTKVYRVADRFLEM